MMLAVCHELFATCFDQHVALLLDGVVVWLCSLVCGLAYASWFWKVFLWVHSWIVLDVCSNLVSFADISIGYAWWWWVFDRLVFGMISIGLVSNRVVWSSNEFCSSMIRSWILTCVHDVRPHAGGIVHTSRVQQGQHQTHLGMDKQMQVWSHKVEIQIQMVSSRSRWAWEMKLGLGLVM